jgi:hypothetical protein
MRQTVWVTMMLFMLIAALAALTGAWQLSGCFALLGLSISMGVNT